MRLLESVWGRQGVPEAKCRRREALEAYGEGKVSRKPRKQSAEGEKLWKRMGKARCPGSKVQKERSSGNVWERQEAPEAPEAKRRKKEAPEAYGECRRT